jgi:hypothetical protein
MPPSPSGVFAGKGHGKIPKTEKREIVENQQEKHRRAYGVEKSDSG